METVTLAGGCFWCTEAIFKRLKGIISVSPGYSGGDTKNPTYEQVSSGKTNHAEAIQIQYDPKVLSFEKILDVFFYTHDPTTLNQQGNDKGSQYRSVIFYHNINQKDAALSYIKKLSDDKIFLKPVVTGVEEYKNFYISEDYHKNYYERNRDNLYCKITIDPKIQKLIYRFKDEILDEYKEN